MDITQETPFAFWPAMRTARVDPVTGAEGEPAPAHRPPS